MAHDLNAVNELRRVAGKAVTLNLIIISVPMEKTSALPQLETQQHCRERKTVGEYGTLRYTRLHYLAEDVVPWYHKYCFLPTRYGCIIGKLVEIKMPNLQSWHNVSLTGIVYLYCHYVAAVLSGLWHGCPTSHACGLMLVSWMLNNDDGVYIERYS